MMAKQDIPFERFYYDKLHRLCYRIGEHDEHFDEMEKVTREDLQALIQAELDGIPMGWIFDWAKIIGDIEFAESVYMDRKIRGINCN